MPKRSNGFEKDPKRASLAGQKSTKHVPEDLKQARITNAKEFEQIIYKYLHMPVEQLKVIYADKTTPARDMVVIKILIMSIDKGDHARLNFLLERTIGKVVDKVETRDTTPTMFVVKPDGTRVGFGMKKDDE